MTKIECLEQTIEALMERIEQLEKHNKELRAECDLYIDRVKEEYIKRKKIEQDLITYIDEDILKFDEFQIDKDYVNRINRYL